MVVYKYCFGSGSSHRNRAVYHAYDSEKRMPLCGKAIIKREEVLMVSIPGRRAPCRKCFSKLRRR